MSDVWLRDSEDQDLYLWSMKRYRKIMTKLPEGRKPLENEWYLDKIRAMTKEERQAVKEKEQQNDSSSE